MILLFRQTGSIGIERAVLAVVAALLALLLFLLGRRRAQRMNNMRVTAGEGSVGDARREVALVGYAVTGFAAAVIILLALS